MTSTFVSYLARNDSAENNESHESPEAKLQPMLLPGEMVIAVAQRVIKFAALTEHSKGVIGSLFVTNFKLSFVTADTSYKLVDQTQQNHLLGPNDVCLTNVDSVYQVSESTHKRRKLELGSNISSKIKILQIVCRDFRVVTFSFKFTPLGEDRGVANSILHYAFPEKAHLLFAYEYKERKIDETDYFGHTRMFNNITDWEDELWRLQCGGWRVTSVNRNFMSKTQPQYYVVPSQLLDSNLTSCASHFPGYRIPFWCWGNKFGCVIVRSACHTRGMYSNQIYDLIKAIKQIHPLGRDPRMVDVEDGLPTLREIHQRFLKLKEFCVPESIPQFWEQDSKFFGLLDSSQWLQTVSAAINMANLVTNVIASHHTSVVLQETEDRDLSCVVSSLAQIMLDAHYRTVAGFQSLIQKEWVAMGHPFLTRLGRLRVEGQESPVFLLFLDCVWQMTQQFPAAFEYTETYLTTVWDSTHMSIFDTYLFDCEHDRRRAAADHINPLTLRPVWNWSRQYTRKQTLLFVNPLYTCAEEITSNTVGVMSVSTARRHSTIHPFPVDRTVLNGEQSRTDLQNNSHTIPSRERGLTRFYRNSSVCNVRLLASHLPDVKSHLSRFFNRWLRYETLPVQDALPLMRIWRLCYFRWMPLVHIIGGGSPAEYMEQCRLVKDIKVLQRKIATLVHNGGAISNASKIVLSDLSLSTVNLAPLVIYDSSEVLTSAYPFSPGGMRPASGMPLSFFRESSYITSDEEIDDE